MLRQHTTVVFHDSKSFSCRETTRWRSSITVPCFSRPFFASSSEPMTILTSKETFFSVPGVQTTSCLITVICSEMYKALKDKLSYFLFPNYFTKILLTCSTLPLSANKVFNSSFNVSSGFSGQLRKNRVRLKADVS